MNLRCSLSSMRLYAFSTACALLQIFASANTINAVAPITYFDAYSGYRLDRITTRLLGYQNNDGDNDRDDFLFEDKIKAKRIGIYVAGVRAQIHLCDYWFVKGHATYGWVTRGRFNEQDTDAFNNEINSCGDINNGRTRDGYIAAGYLYPVSGYYGCWGIGPVAGWGMSDQRIHMKNMKTEGVDNPFLRNLKYTTRWTGPYVGVDAVYDWCKWRINGSAEYHWVYWHGKYIVEQDVVGVVFTDRRRSTNDADAFVFSIDVQWEFWPEWYAGLGAKTEFWENKGGRMKPRETSFTNAGFPEITKVRVNNSRWYSDTFIVYVGACF